MARWWKEWSLLGTRSVVIGRLTWPCGLVLWYPWKFRDWTNILMLFFMLKLARFGFCVLNFPISISPQTWIYNTITANNSEHPSARGLKCVGSWPSITESSIWPTLAITIIVFKLHNSNLIRLHFEIPVDVVIPFLGIYPEQINHHCFFKDIHHSVIYCLKIINQKQYKCASLRHINTTKNNIFKEQLRPWREYKTFYKVTSQFSVKTLILCGWYISLKVIDQIINILYIYIMRLQVLYNFFKLESN